MERKSTVVSHSSLQNAIGADNPTWYSQEIEYLRQMHTSCVELSKEYMKLYTSTHKIQTKLRLPAIILSSCSGVASFGSAGFDESAQRWISIGVGIVNVGIAIIQTYESYLKIADIVATSLTTSTSLKKLADDIHTEIYIPIEDRDSSGITFLRDCFSRYQVILEQAPPLSLEKFDRSIIGYAENTAQRIHEVIKASDMASRSKKNSESSSIESGMSTRAQRQTLPLDEYPSTELSKIAIVP